MDLVCAACLVFEARRRSRRLEGKPAWTLINGAAVCRDDFELAFGKTRSGDERQQTVRTLLGPFDWPR
ncbi:hypothetical protein [Frankia sp. AvcI1]|uniref:hypothetical protein n=1 Tax=Frankia sp. AvcI1 TaxID=573496 RepID=UPI0021187A5E|nr:hypothetical protein [Frankia sp. AvcI1]